MQQTVINGTFEFFKDFHHCSFTLLLVSKSSLFLFSYFYWVSVMYVFLAALTTSNHTISWGSFIFKFKSSIDSYNSYLSLIFYHLQLVNTFFFLKRGGNPPCEKYPPRRIFKIQAKRDIGSLLNRIQIPIDLDRLCVTIVAFWISNIMWTWKTCL